MRRRRGSSPGISLFAFQDIITSVSGVLILIVLLLVLELTQRTLDASVEQAYQDTADQIRESMDELSKERENIEAELSDSDRLAELLIENPEHILDENVQRQKTAIAKKQEELKRLQEAAAKIDAAEKELAEALKEIDKLKAELAELEKGIENEEGEIEAINSGEGGIYAVPRGVDPEGAWICEVTATKLTFFPMSGNSDSDSVTVGGDGKKALGEIRQWISRTKPRPTYVLFAIRPSGAALSDTLSVDGDSLGISLGFDLIGKDMVLRNSQGVPFQ